jgi:membrane fusion protein, multidrug efflux system
MIIRTAALLAIVGITFWGVACHRDAPEEIESETVVPVTAMAAETGSITAEAHATGLVAPAPGAELLVVAPEPARIVEIPKAEGDTVKRGDVLVRFEIPSTAAEVSKQDAETKRAQARLENARAALSRARDLFDRGVAARKEVEDATREIADAEADVAAAQAATTAAGAMAARSVVRATFDGIVAKRSHNPGDLVEATAADAVLRVVDPRRVEVIASVPILDSLSIRVGAPARIVDAPASAGDNSLKVVARPAAVQPGTATVAVRIAFAKPTRYPVGTPVQVGIETDTHMNAVLVPASAIVREGEENAVFVVENETAKRREVKIGIENGGRVEIISGVKLGEMVITSGQNGLPDGAKVTLAARDEK